MTQQRTATILPDDIFIFEMRLIMSKLHSGTFFAKSVHWPQDSDTQTVDIS